ncbi:hypothetical protein P168DRAFT_1369 [Aspergillus campestris IBT 28561]|uniref:Uncharacterized protein n=1 Tax=Aspergillus campestris (strain IBT 28561) TaxID=1392248 RepID=A0A2I1DCZ3_ASPC2|nr:uncharacterized protein P168DRAFT_1369 [Aspergillus campestris IBT 28561]PKY07743.1 hypothetical protein P168DRAFT_1369 [Aspergillus campestris IBT 28561]
MGVVNYLNRLSPMCLVSVSSLVLAHRPCGSSELRVPSSVDPSCGGSGSLQATSPLPLPSPFPGKQTNESPGETSGGRKSSLPISSARFFSSNSTGWSENGGPKGPYNPDLLYIHVW